MSEQLCAICDQPLSFVWTDTHGIAKHTTCGAPYRIIHYDGDGAEHKRVIKPAELLIDDTWLPLVKQYWQEEHAPVNPGSFSFPGGQACESREAFERHNRWFNAHEAEWPVKAEEEEVAS